MVSEDPAPATRPNALDAPTEDPGPHLSYAIQWILFALMGFIFIGYIIRTEIKVRREDAEDAAAEAELPENAPKPPRRPRTADQASRPRHVGRGRDPRLSRPLTLVSRGSGVRPGR